MFLVLISNKCVPEFLVEELGRAIIRLLVVVKILIESTASVGDAHHKGISREHVEFSVISGADHEDDLFYTAENLEKVFTFIETALS